MTSLQVDIIVAYVNFMHVPPGGLLNPSWMASWQRSAPGRRNLATLPFPFMKDLPQPLCHNVALLLLEKCPPEQFCFTSFAKRQKHGALPYLFRQSIPQDVGQNRKSTHMGGC